MVNRDCPHTQVSHLKNSRVRNGDILHHWAIIILQIGESPIDVPVKYIAFEKCDDLSRRINAHRFFKCGIEIVDEDGKACNVGHVRVSDDDVPHGTALLWRESDRNTACVNSYAVVD